MIAATLAPVACSDSHAAMLLACTLAVAACTDTHEPVVIDIDDGAEVSKTFDVDGEREVRLVPSRSMIAEVWLAGGSNTGGGLGGAALVSDGLGSNGLGSGALVESNRWFVPQPIDGERTFTVAADGEVTLTAWGRGAVPPTPTRARSATWFDAALLDDPTAVSFARVMAIVAGDTPGSSSGASGALLERWFEAFAAGPGAGRATFAQFLDGIRTEQGSDPRGWNLATLPFKVTGVHNRIDLSRGAMPGAPANDCGELRISIASTHPTLAPLHFLFIFHQPAQPDDMTPDGAVHCRGTARRWAALAGLSPADFATAARAWLDGALTHANFALAESVELTLSPWQWRQWIPDGAGGLTNPPLFQTIDVPRLNVPGPTRDAFLAEVAQHQDEMLARTWAVPPAFRPRVAEAQPTEKAALVDVPSPQLAEALGMIGCPRCHTENADFVQTSVDRVPSPFYDKELDARTARIDALAQGRAVAPSPFGPLQ